MHREGEDVWVFGQDRRAAISLMNVEVDDGHTPDVMTLSGDTRADSEVVEDTVTRAPVVVGVMGSTGHVCGDAALVHHIGEASDGSADQVACAWDNQVRPRSQADFTSL